MRQGSLCDALHPLSDRHFQERHPRLTSNLSFQQLHGITWLHAVNRLHHDGLWLVYRGFLPPLLQRAASGALMFGTQGKAERWLLHNSFTSELPLGVNTCIAAIVAGCFEAPLMPFERIQTLLLNKKYYVSYRNSFHAVDLLVRTYGVSELYRGFTPVIWRNCIGNTLYFCGHQWLINIKGHKDQESAVVQSLWNFAFGGFLGAFIGLITFPLNVAKTRMQSEVGGRFFSLRSTFSDLIHHQNDRLGFVRLYRGLPANFVRSIVSWGVITMTYQLLLGLTS